MLLRLIAHLFFLLIISLGCSSQHKENISRLELTKESVVLMPDIIESSFIGYFDQSSVFQKVIDQNNNTFAAIVVDEDKRKSHATHKIVFTPPFTKSDWNSGFLSVIGFDNDIWFYTVGYNKNNYSIYYKTLWAQLNSTGENYLIDTVYNADKSIHISVSSDKRHLVINTLNTLAEYYSAGEDDKFTIVSLDSLRKGKITKTFIPCGHCADGYIINDRLIFTKSSIRDDFDNGYSWTDIFSAPLNKIQDSTKIAAFSDIIDISQDGKYILAKRIFDLPNSPRAIIDVDKKRYQLLLGRNYNKVPAFYSKSIGKFAFDFNDKLIYIDLPTDFPFSSLRKYNPDIPAWSDKDFYKNFQHKEF